MITVNSTINLTNQAVPPIIPVVQGDTGRAIAFTLADFTIPAGATATYYVQKPSGEAVYNSAEISGNTVTVELTAQSIIEVGENNLQVRIILDEAVVTSFDVILMVRPFRGIGAVESETEMNIFDKAVEQATEEIEAAAQEAEEYISQAIDDTLTIEGKAADAKATGNAINDLRTDLNELYIDKATAGTGEVYILSDETITDVAVTGEASSLTVRNTQMFEGKYPGQPGTSYGVTVTKNSDDSYTINGTATSSVWYFLNQSTRQGSDNLINFTGKYSLMVERISGSYSKTTATGDTMFITGIRPYDSNSVSALNIAGAPAGYEKYTVTKEIAVTNGVFALRLTNGVQYNNFRIKIMLNHGEPLPWVKYAAPVTLQDFSNIPAAANNYLPNLWMYTNDDSEITVTQKYAPKEYIDENITAMNDKIETLTAFGANVITANHRGYHDGFPENTLWAFAQSKIKGFDWIETDVRLTSDGVAVLLHDESINRTARNADGTSISSTINISDITYEQALDYDFGIYAGSQFAGTKIVTAEECIAFCKNAGLNIVMEVKVINSGTICAGLAKKYAMEDHIIWASFGSPELAEVNAVLPTATIALTSTQEPTAALVESASALKTANNSVYLSLNYQYPITALIDSMVSNDIGYCVYTLNSAAALESLSPLCSVIISDTLIANKQMASDAINEWTLD